MRYLLIVLFLVVTAFADEVYKCVDKSGNVILTTSPSYGMTCKQSKESSATLVKTKKGDFYYDAKTDTYYRKLKNGWLNTQTGEWKESL